MLIKEYGGEGAGRDVSLSLCISASSQRVKIGRFTDIKLVPAAFLVANHAPLKHTKWWRDDLSGAWLWGDGTRGVMVGWRGGVRGVDTDSTISDRRGQDLSFSPVNSLEEVPLCRLISFWYRLFSF